MVKEYYVRLNSALRKFMFLLLQVTLHCRILCCFSEPEGYNFFKVSYFYVVFHISSLPTSSFAAPAGLRHTD